MNDLRLHLNKFHDLIDNSHLTRDTGKVTELVGQMVKGYLPGAALGSICELQPVGSDRHLLTEVVGFKDQSVLMMPLSDLRGVGLGSKINLLKERATVRVGPDLLGRVMNGLGEIIDSKPEFEGEKDVPLYGDVYNPLDRKPIRTPLDLGVKALNGVLTIGEGQRIGIMAGSGVGKSVLLGMMSRYSKADVNVIALIGERGREVREFIENDLGPEGMSRSVVIVVTSDQSPLIRMRGAFMATAIAEYFSGLGKNVLLMMDSITRFAMAQREIGLSVGEPPASKGYPPSVFGMLPKLIERTGSFEKQGSITGLYTVLVEGDDMDDPIADSVRSIVDGHIVLTRNLAQRGHFPAIDVLQSASRVMRSIVDEDHMNAALKLRELLAVYKDAEDLINIGAYKQGANPKIDKAVKLIDSVNVFLKQRLEEPSSFSESIGILKSITDQV